MQRFPEDYDAIAASGLDGHTTRHTLAQLWVWQATHKNEASYIPPAKYPLLHLAAMIKPPTFELEIQFIGRRKHFFVTARLVEQPPSK